MSQPQRPWHPQQPPHVSGPPYAPGPYPQLPPPPYGYRPPPRKKSFWTSTGGILTMVFGGIGAFILVCGGLMTLGMFSEREAAADMDVSITSCTFDGGGGLTSATVGLRVTNNGDRARTTRVDIEYRSGGSRIDTDTAVIRDVRPGDTAQYEETTLLDAAVSSGTCHITEVS